MKEPHKRDEPTAYRDAGPTVTAASTQPFRLRRRRQSVSAVEILEWIKQQPEDSGWMATTKGIELALDDICA